MLIRRKARPAPGWETTVAVWRMLAEEAAPPSRIDRELGLSPGAARKVIVELWRDERERRSAAVELIGSTKRWQRR